MNNNTSEGKSMALATDHDLIPAADSKEVPVRNVSDSWASMPKRKPIPGPHVTTTAIPVETTTNAESTSNGQRRAWKFLSTDFFHLPANRRRRFLIFGAVLAVALLALIIGLAVGLTVKKK